MAANQRSSPSFDGVCKETSLLHKYNTESMFRVCEKFKGYQGSKVSRLLAKSRDSDMQMYWGYGTWTWTCTVHTCMQTKAPMEFRESRVY